MLAVGRFSGGAPVNIIALPSTPFAAVPTGHSRSDCDARLAPAVQDVGARKRGIFPVNFSSVVMMLNAFHLAPGTPATSESAICLALDKAPHGLPASPRPSPRSLWAAIENIPTLLTNSWSGGRKWPR